MLICDIERILSFVIYFETNLLYSLSWPWTHDFLASAWDYSCEPPHLA